MKRPIGRGDDKTRFAPRVNTEQVEEGHVLAPKFDADGLITCVVTDAWSGEVLMVAHMNAEALARTIETAEAWFFSRSRGALWRKGETSGHTQRVIEMRVDCDQDAIWMRVEQTGPGACHTGRVSCFYRTIRLKEAAGPAIVLDFAEERTFNPASVYDKDK
jgi:phosphoribosyl-AMP cyclohydrolase